MINSINKRVVDNSWNFEAANTKEFTHCYHNYPAMMIPQVARRLINEYKTATSKLLFDPYCGTGTSLVEANLVGLNAIGSDLNPLARLIAKTKTTKFDIEQISKSASNLNNLIKKFDSKFNPNYDLFTSDDYILEDNDIKYSIPNFTNIDYWFSDNVKKRLGFLKYLIDEQVAPQVKDFFLIPFSETVRESSYTRNSEFKLFRMPQEKLKDFSPDVSNIFFNKISRNIKGLSDYLANELNGTYSNVFDVDTCKTSVEQILNGDLIDLIVTSPPYGDSKTTVAYGQFSRLSNQWLGVIDANQVDNNLMGGNSSFKSGYLEFDSAKKELELIKEADLKRYNEVQSFLIDYYNSIKNISPFIRKAAYVCYVLGNRTVKGIQIPLDLITVEIFVNLGYEHITTIIRDIPNKRMPSINSPSNIAGVTASTMNNELIVVVKKL